MRHCPQHVCAVLLVERIMRVDDEEPPVLLLGMMLQQKPHRVDSPFNPCLQATV